MNPLVAGIGAAVLANLIWGLAPIYYKSLAAIPALELLAHRAVWSVVFFALILGVQGRLADLRQGFRRPHLPVLACAASLIIVNWGLFIWAILEGRVTEASLGYFIYPLIAVLLGRMFLGEALRPLQWTAVGLAFAAVVLLTWGLGTLPWIALTLASTFSLYALIKKQMPLGPVLSVSTEAILLFPVFLGVLIWIHGQGGGHFGTGPGVSVMLSLAGPITALPLLLFSFAARRVRLSSLGLIQYINPTLQFLVATMIFMEPLSQWHRIAFPMIWVALALYSVSAWRAERASRRASSAASGVSATR